MDPCRNIDNFMEKHVRVIKIPAIGLEKLHVWNTGRYFGDGLVTSMMDMLAWGEWMGLWC